MRRRADAQRGLSLAEVVVGLGIIAVMIYASMAVTQSAHRMTTINNDKEFATQKAISMLEEMKSLVQTNTTTDITVLDRFDDGIVAQPVLTIQGTRLPSGSTAHVTLPDDPISGNVPYGPGKWTYDRLITVQRLPQQASDVRLVNVKVFKNAEAGHVLLAEVSGVLRALVTTMPPSQVYDVYAVAVENVPGWWVYMTDLVPFVQNAIGDLQARNPGLVFRTHWIKSLAYGRDLEYTPYVNQAAPSTADINSVYFYPGTMPSGSCCGAAEYYPPSYFVGRVNIDGTAVNGYDKNKNPYPYAEADQYNHALRYYDELALYNARHAANDREEMTLRLLLDDMYARPYLYTNALVINLHGELLPLPPVRNYSDAAKDPEQTSAPDLSYARVVTHPEQLRYLNTDDVTLRVYSYLSDPNQPNKDILPVPITVTIAGANGWIPTKGDIKGITGGVDIGGGGPTPAYVKNNSIDPCPAKAGAKEMCFTATLAPNGVDTVVKLYNSPLRCPFDVNNGGGINYASRLYGLEYIPSPVEDLTAGAAPFSIDLATTAARTKNTARWMITIPAARLAKDFVGTVDTRIGDQLTSGTLYPTRNHPANLSRTFFWRGTDTFVFGDPAANPPVPAALPLSEQFQFQGDPRHCPYSDLKRPHLSGNFPKGPIPPAGSYESALGMGYNRYFDDFEDTHYNATTDALLLAETPATGATYTVPVGANVFKLSIDSGSWFTVSVKTGARTPSQVANDLNSNGTFSAVASADALGPRLRIISKPKVGKVPSVQFDPTVTNSAAGVFGYDSWQRPAAAWAGWNYAIGAQKYGVQNDTTIGNAGWDGTCGRLEVDVNRYFQMVRTGLIRTNALWTTMTGWSYYYIGLGGEIGYDSANNFANSIPVSSLPFGGASGSSQWVDSITNDPHPPKTTAGSGTGTFLVRDNSGNGWWSMPWIGENYPDWAYASGGVDWKTYGNLGTSGANPFVRDARDNFPAFSGTNLTQAVRRTCRAGCTGFFWSGTAAATFHHNGGSGGNVGTMQPDGTNIANGYSFPVPSTIDSNRPFGPAENDPTWNPTNFLQGAYGNANNLAVLNTYFLHNSGMQSSALLANRDASFNVSFVAVNGLSPTGTSGTNFIARWSFLSLVQSYLNGGLYTDTSTKPTAHHIRQLPRLVINSPNPGTNLSNPPSVPIAWDIYWQRWDGKAYTPSYPPSYSEALTMKYAVLYSTTNGFPDPANGINTGWFYMKDDTEAKAGVKPDAAHELTATSYTWDTSNSTKFPQGNYLIRVEGYREGYPLHFAFHQYRAFIKR